MTWRRLSVMAEARRADAWDRTAALLVLLYNINRKSSSPAGKPEDFHPLRGDGTSLASKNTKQVDGNFNAVMCDALLRREAREKVGRQDESGHT